MLTSAMRSPVLRESVFVIVGLVGGVLIGAAYAFRATYGVALLGLLLLLFTLAARPVLLAVAALVGVYLVQRVGSGSSSSGGISYSDLLLALAALFALPSLVRDVDLLRRLRLPMIGLAVYLACLLPTVFRNSSPRASLEWAHRLVLVGGAVVVGAWIVREGIVRPALRWLVAVSGVIAGAAVVYAVRSGFEPAYPLGLNKNLVGTLLGAVLVFFLVAGDSLGLKRGIRIVLVLLVAAGLLASQSRGGLLGAAAGLLIAFVADTRTHTRGARVLSALVALVFAAVVVVSVRSEFDRTKAENNNTSIGTRINVERETFEIWQTSEITGVGLKYFNTGAYGQFGQASNNVVNNELAESGLVGLAGFVAMQFTVFGHVLRRRRDGPFALAALGVLSGALVHGQVDIYWSAGSSSLPFILLGMALAMPTSARTGAVAGPPSHRSAAASS